MDGRVHDSRPPVAEVHDVTAGDGLAGVRGDDRGLAVLLCHLPEGPAGAFGKVHYRADGHEDLAAPLVNEDLRVSHSRASAPVAPARSR